MKRKLLIMTVYGPSDYNQHWYYLQKKFIKKNTTIPFDFKIISNNVDEDSFNLDDVAIFNSGNIGHPKGLRQAINYMNNSKGYTEFLLLDSDCFPVRTGWHNILNNQMISHNKNIVAPIRFENLDLFPHPCVVYFNKKGLENPGLNFDYAKVKNLMGDEIEEVGGNMQKIIQDVFPLLRTNKVNMHHVAAGIYHHLFYHHGAGSRGFQFRVQKEYKYYDHIGLDDNEEILYGDKLINALINDPESYIDKLMYGY